LELIYKGRSLLTGRPLAAVFDLGGLSSYDRSRLQYREVTYAFAYGFVRFCGFFEQIYGNQSYNRKKSVEKSIK
jgi:hypothetical protein